MARRYHVNQQECIELFSAFGISSRSLNYYTLRLKPDEQPGIMFDWFHTTGTVVKHKNGVPKRVSGVYPDAEKLAELLTKKSL